MKRLIILLLSIIFIVTGCKPSVENLLKQGKYKEAYLQTQEKSKLLAELYAEKKYKEVFECIKEDKYKNYIYIDRMVEDDMIQECLDAVILNEEYQNYLATSMVNKNKFVPLSKDSMWLSSDLQKYNFLSDVLQNVLKYYINLREFKTTSKNETLKLQRKAIDDIGNIYIWTKNSDYKDDWDESQEKEFVKNFIKGLTSRIIIYNKSKEKLYEFYYTNSSFTDTKNNGFMSENKGNLDDTQAFTLGSAYTGYNYYRLLSTYINSKWIDGLKKYVTNNLK